MTKFIQEKESRSEGAWVARSVEHLAIGMFTMTSLPFRFQHFHLPKIKPQTQQTVISHSISPQPLPVCFLPQMDLPVLDVSYK